MYSTPSVSHIHVDMCSETYTGNWDGSHKPTSMLDTQINSLPFQTTHIEKQPIELGRRQLFTPFQVGICNNILRIGKSDVLQYFSAILYVFFRYSREGGINLTEVENPSAPQPLTTSLLKTYVLTIFIFRLLVPGSGVILKGDKAEVGARGDRRWLSILECIVITNAGFVLDSREW